MKVTLGSLREYVHENYFSILVEGRVEDARDKYPDMEDENFDYLVSNQPAGSNNKYLLWACKQADALLEEDPDPQGLRIVIQAVRLFDGSKQRLEKKDLNQYTDTSEVEAAIEKLGGASKNQQAKQARADTDTVYNDDQFTVIRPHTAEASCKYGVGTKWCIAATSSRNYFGSYSESNNKFYFVIDKRAEANATTSKFAIVIKDPITSDNTPKIQVFNAPDNQVGLNAVIKHCGKKWPAIWAKIQEHVESQPITRQVEEAQKDVEEHVKNLLKGEKVSKEGLGKIAKSAKLTPQIVSRLIAHLQEYTGPQDYTDPRASIISSLVERSEQLPSEGALALIKYISSTKPAHEGYWIGAYQLESLIKRAPLTPDAFRELARSKNETQLGPIINNPNCPIDIIERLATRLPDLRNSFLKKDIYRSLIKRGVITAEQMRDAVVAGSRYDSITYEILHDPELSSKLSPELLRLVPVNNANELKRMLDLPNVPSDLAADLITQHWKQLTKHDLYELMRNVSISTEMIERIWADKDPHIRTALLQNPSIGADNAAKFAASRNSAYRFAVAHNTILPPENLQILGADESASTRAAVASNANTPVEMLKTLANDEADVVRASTASNSKTPRNVLDTLKKDSDDFVRKSARKTLKSLETTESYSSAISGMLGLLKEEMADDDTPDTMTPYWTEIPTRTIRAADFVAVYLLQNNGHATREDIEAAFQLWNPQHETTQSYRGRNGRRRNRIVKAKNVWQVLKHEEQHNEPSARTTSASGKGWWWAPPGINKGALFRLTPTGAAAALESLQKARTTYGFRNWTTHEQPVVKKSPRRPDLDASTIARPTRTPVDAAVETTPRGPKTTYKIYGKFKGHPVSTRLKGQAYVGATNTQFAAGEQAEISTDNGKLKVKKAGGDHTQTWEPIDG